MMNIFKSTQSVGEIVAMMPRASEIFKEYHIDFCCGGDHPLKEAIKNQNLNESEILHRLNTTYEEIQKAKGSEIDFRKMSPTELIEHVVTTHHSYLKKALPELSELTSKILRVHGPHHDELFKVHKLFHNIKTDLDEHLIKEEEMLFPMIKEYEKTHSPETLAAIEKTLRETEAEHQAVGDLIKEIRSITSQYRLPEDGCATYQLTYDKMQEMESDLFEHIHLENNILFKQLGLDTESEMNRPN
jgi:regulator of cell morphogenesis and NO signaling